MDFYGCLTMLLFFWCSTSIFSSEKSLQTLSQTHNYTVSLFGGFCIEKRNYRNGQSACCVQGQLQFCGGNDSSLTRRLIVLALFRGGLELNPGPGTKRRRHNVTEQCVWCGCFKGKGECKCLKSPKLANISNVTLTPLSSDADPLLEANLYSVISKGRKIIGSQHSLQHVCNKLEVSFQGLFLPTSLIDEHPLSDLVPGSCVDVPGDGNCLFLHFL